MVELFVVCAMLSVYGIGTVLLSAPSAAESPSIPSATTSRSATSTTPTSGVVHASTEDADCVVVENPTPTHHTDCHGMDLVFENLSNKNLSYADFSGATMTSAILTKANLTDANLAGADLAASIAGGANFTGADLQDARAPGEARWMRVDLNGANLSGINLHTAHMDSATAVGANFTGADLGEADLPADLSKATLRGANLSEAHALKVNLAEANLSGSNLLGIGLSQSNFTGVNLFSANLRRANLSGSDLSGANLTKANLTSADFRGATITGAIFNQTTICNGVAPGGGAWDTSCSVYALGDSWTAGFGWYGDGSEMATTALLSCKPGQNDKNDRCSSNSDLSWYEGNKPLSFSADYGYGNDITWPAQVAHVVKDRFGFVKYVNLAVSGATPQDLLPGGKLSSTTERMIKADPAIVLMTLGGNPALGDVIEGFTACANHRKTIQDLVNCTADQLYNVYHAPQNLEKLYTEIIQKAPDVHLVTMGYMITIPDAKLLNDFSPQEWRAGAQELDLVIQAAVAGAKAQLSPGQALRLSYLAPPVPATGAFPGNVQCRVTDIETKVTTEFTADGSSVMNVGSQHWMALYQQKIHQEFCGKGDEYKAGGVWKPAGDEIWFDSTDLGTHLNRLGYAQMAKTAVSFLESEHLIPPAS
jgi:uncharacterized protein YjbI with pentapeptide repeats/lysophospholipase L1-like esterase